jgi:uncharacterized iron-regulated protein
MNRNLLFIGLAWWAVLINVSLRAQDAAPAGFAPKVIATKSGQEISVEQLADAVAKDDVVFLGEEHDSDGAHQLQAAVVRELILKGANIAISMEMFERDVQGVLNEYLDGRISEEEFLYASRPWKNYAEHYREIVELAKEHRIPVIAANVPRELAAALAKGQAIDQSQAAYQARKLTAPEDLYWEKFSEIMKGHGGVDNAAANRRMYESQCLKDDTMAESIADFLATHRHRHVTVVHLCGKFHSDFGLGTASRVNDLNGLARVTIVSTERTEDLSKFESRKYRAQAHYLFVVPPNAAKE